MSVHGHAVSEGAEPANFYGESGAWAMDPPELEPVFNAYQQGEHFVIHAEDNARQAIAAEHPVEIEQ